GSAILARRPGSPGVSLRSGSTVLARITGWPDVPFRSGRTGSAGGACITLLSRRTLLALAGRQRQSGAKHRSISKVHLLPPSVATAIEKRARAAPRPLRHGA